MVPKVVQKESQPIPSSIRALPHKQAIIIGHPQQLCEISTISFVLEQYRKASQVVSRKCDSHLHDMEPPLFGSANPSYCLMLLNVPVFG